MTEKDKTKPPQKKKGRSKKRKSSPAQRYERAGFKRTFPPYHLAKLCAQEECDATSRAQYMRWHYENGITHIPCDPAKVYKDKFEGWADYLGTGNIFNPYQYRKNIEDGVLPFWEAARWAQSLGLKNSHEWREYYKEHFQKGTLPKGIPYDPSRHYDEWKPRSGWEIWLGRDSQQKKDDIKRKVQVQQKVKENTYVALIWESGDPNNVVSVFKTNISSSIREKTQSNTCRFIQAYDISSEEDQLLFDNLINNHTTAWYGNDNKRLSPNWNQVKWELDCKLLLFRPS